MESDVIAQLKREWFERLDRILSNGNITPPSNLKCLEMCQAKCCPRIAMRTMPQRDIASPIVVLLPFEMEFLIEKTGVSPALFRRWTIPITSTVTLDIGMLDLGKPCPFLRENLQCGIHEHNPLDCRTFPLLPSRNAHGNMEWELGENCPSFTLLNPAFAEHIKRIWLDLDPMLPQAWWDLYAFADHWTGWPEPSEMRDGR